MTQSDPLGLSALTDDQVVAMAQALATEMSRRPSFVYKAAAAAFRRETESEQARLEWRHRKTLGLMVQVTLPYAWTLSVRNDRYSGRRATLECSTPFHRGGITLHVTGDGQNPPGSLSQFKNTYFSRNSREERMVTAILSHAAAMFPALSGLDMNAAAAYTDVEPMPFPPEFSEAMQS